MKNETKGFKRKNRNSFDDPEYIPSKKSNIKNENLKTESYKSILTILPPSESTLTAVEIIRNAIKKTYTYKNFALVEFENLDPLDGHSIASSAIAQHTLQPSLDIDAICIKNYLLFKNFSQINVFKKIYNEKYSEIFPLKAEFFIKNSHLFKTAKQRKFFNEVSNVFNEENNIFRNDSQKSPAIAEIEMQKNEISLTPITPKNIDEEVDSWLKLD